MARLAYKTAAGVAPAGGRDGGLPGVTLPWSLLPGLLRDLLVEGGEDAAGVELLEGAAGAWTVAR